MHACMRAVPGAPPGSIIPASGLHSCFSSPAPHPDLRPSGSLDTPHPAPCLSLQEPSTHEFNALLARFSRDSHAALPKQWGNWLQPVQRKRAAGGAAAQP